MNRNRLTRKNKDRKIENKLRRRSKNYFQGLNFIFIDNPEANYPD